MPRRAAPVRDAEDPAAARITAAPVESASDPPAPTEIRVAGLPDTGWPVWSGLTGLILIVLGTIIAWEQLRRVVWPALLVYAEGLMNWIDRRMDLR